MNKPTITKHPDWENQLQLYLESKREADEPCAYFATGAVKVTTGLDMVALMRGRMAWARDHLAEAVSEILEPRPVAMARSGDLVMKEGNLGVCYGADSAFMAMHEGQPGLTMVPTLQCGKAWSVG